MATGDKLFLADKQTLDEIKQLVEGLSQTTRVESNSYTSEDTGKLNYLTKSITSSANFTEVLNLSESSGELYYTVINVNSNITNVKLQVIIDGKQIIDGTTSGPGTYALGLVSSNSILGVNSSGHFILLNGRTLHGTISPLTNNTINSSAVNIVSNKPIRWNRSIIIRATITGTDSSANVYYKLD